MSIINRIGINMSYLNNYGGVIWTNHVLERLKQRDLSQDIALQAFKYPDKTLKGKKKDTIEYQKTFQKSLITLIAIKNEKNEWVIISGWIDPPLPGSYDYKKKEEYKKYQKASFLGKLFLTFKKQLGL